MFCPQCLIGSLPCNVSPKKSPLTEAGARHRGSGQVCPEDTGASPLGNCSTLPGSQPFPRGAWGRTTSAGLWDASTQLPAGAHTAGSPQPREPPLTLPSLGDLLGRKKAREEKKPHHPTMSSS